MKVLIGEGTGRLIKEARTMGWGRMWIARARNIYTYPGEPWGLDNGAFRDWKDGVPFCGDTYLRVVDKALAQDTPPYLVVLPDIPGGGLASLELSLSWIEKLPPEWPMYLATQDGMATEDVEPHMDVLSGLFLGGTNGWKATAETWAALAHQHGKRFHYGRAGTMEKVRHAVEVNADSLDSAFPMWTRERWRLFAAAIANGPPQYHLFAAKSAAKGDARP